MPKFNDFDLDIQVSSSLPSYSRTNTFTCTDQVHYLSYHYSECCPMESGYCVKSNVENPKCAEIPLTEVICKI